MSMSSAAIPTFEITLGALSKLLDKAEGGNKEGYYSQKY